MAGSFLMAVFMFTEGALSAVYGHAVPGVLDGVTPVTWVVPDPSAGKAIIACSYLCIAAYAPTWGPLGWCVINLSETDGLLTADRIYPAEIIPLHIRSKVVSIAT